MFIFYSEYNLSLTCFEDWKKNKLIIQIQFNNWVFGFLVARLDKKVETAAFQRENL